MKASDYNKPTDNISTPTSLAALERNSGAAGKQVNWRTAKIDATQGAKESDPFRPLRQVLMDAEPIAKNAVRLHKRLDVLIDKDCTYTPTSRKALHTALDEIMARAKGETSDSAEPEEASSDSAEIVTEDSDEMEATDEMRQLNDSLKGFERELGRHLSRTHVGDVAHGRGFIQDGVPSVVARYLEPTQSCQDALVSLQDSLYSKQKDSTTMGYWRGLYFHLSHQPAGTLVKQVRAATLAPLIKKLDENRI